MPRIPTRAWPLPALLLASATLAGCAYLGRRATITFMNTASNLGPDKVWIELNREFVEQYQNRVTITTTFTVDAAAGSPNPPALDGDLHFAGRAPEIGLRIVAEIINASEQDSAVALVHRAARDHRALPLTGVWRIWPEHSLGYQEEQGRPVARLETPYADHLFEIHPITRIGGNDLLPTFHALEGYRPGAAEGTLGSYQNARCTLKVTPGTVIFETPTWLYNDVHFLMQIVEPRQQEVGDGRFVMASAHDSEGKLLVPRVRMVFVKGTAPERMVKSLPRGRFLHVYGLPRLDFSEIVRRVRSVTPGSAPLEGPLPYEIVVLGVYPEATIKGNR